MKTRFTFLLLLSLCSIKNNLQAQYITKVVGYYKTYEDFLNSNFQKMDDLNNDVDHHSPSRLVFILDGKKVKVDAKHIWGLRAGYGELYRVNHYDNHIYRVVEIGKIILYYLGSFTYTNPGHGLAESEPFYAFSSDLNSEIESFGKLNQKSNQEILSKYPQYKPLFDCIGIGSKADSNINSCVESFNAGELK